ncbi:hypothetical protein [Prosthecobacter sp.]|uniref:hypothetical protein n=1 Tax=Prosthecobacter sp. TaxID=1965333 RepID=UPI00378401FE
MALSSSAKARSGGGVTRRRVKSPRAMPEGAGAADGTGMSCTTSGEGGGAPVAAGPGATAAGATMAGCEAAGAGALVDGAAGSHTTSSAEANAASALAGGAVGVAQAGVGANSRAGVPARLRLWLDRARGLGLTEPEVVFDLHVRQGLPLLNVARVLDVGLEAVRGLWLQSRASRAAQTPQSEPDFIALREHIAASLWQTVESTFPDVMSMADADEDADPPGAPTPPMLSVRLKALDQIAKLYDITLETPASDHGPLPYTTPEDIAVSVRERVLGLFGRG